MPRRPLLSQQELIKTQSHLMRDLLMQSMHFYCTNRSLINFTAWCIGYPNNLGMERWISKSHHNHGGQSFLLRLRRPGKGSGWGSGTGVGLDDVARGLISVACSGGLGRERKRERSILATASTIYVFWSSSMRSRSFVYSPLGFRCHGQKPDP